MNRLLFIIGIYFVSITSGQLNPENDIAGFTSPKQQCVCVEYFKCKTGVNPNEPAIDVRLGEKCTNILHVCCEPENLLSNPETHPNARHVKCGKSNPNGVEFPVDDTKYNQTKFGEFPWIVGLLQEQLYAKTNKTIFVYQCAGSLIHPQVVLTAAHCVMNRTISKLRVRAGEWDTQTTNELYPHQDRYVNRIVMHDSFYAPALHNDVALLFLTKPFMLDEHIDTVCIPNINIRFNTDQCYGAGWGKNNFGGRYSVILKKLHLPLVERIGCLKALRRTRLGSRFQLHESFICAGGEYEIDMCKGDGGSPLVCEMLDQPGHFQQVGIVAWGIGCGEQKLPAAYVNVLWFRSWIDQQMALVGLNSSTYTY
ncbi:phenoloxidase-activating factor 2-like [Chrysoperla carnea]|uniref:phenoloxidase-activating factor 2-like n=1 Tax=Chrysoperla carnea TaxID=189513 RepID=UPI001D06B69C|nr:phenoloxidase-activating factor 2-like [Chrysoperla carnea]